MEKILLSQLENEYNTLKPALNDLLDGANSQIEKLIYDNNISLGFPIQKRIKSWGSIEDKYTRFNYGYKSILKLQDLVGFRIILLFKKDVEKVSKIIGETFKICKPTYNPSDKLKDNQFDYSSLHMVVQIPDGWQNIPTFRKCQNIPAEIQIRTIAQHMWAETSYHFQYKREESVPRSLRRTIYRLSALLELVDKELDLALIEKDSYKEQEVKIKGNRELDVIILESILDEMLPPKNKIDDDYGDLLEELIEFDINTTDKLRDLINDNLDYALENDKKMVLHTYQDGYDNISADQAVDELAYFAFSGLIRVMLERVFGEAYEFYQMQKKSVEF